MRDRNSSRGEEATVDGRRLRREQGRIAVLDATIDLILAGVQPPSVDQIADQSGVSTASIYRYFSTVDELRRAGITRYLDRYNDLMAIPDIGVGGLDERVDNLVTSRLAFFETVAPISRLARQQATTSPAMSDTLERVRATLKDQLAQHFAIELDAMRPAARVERLAVIATLTSFEGWDQLAEFGLTRAAIGRAWRNHLGVLLDPTLG